MTKKFTLTLSTRDVLEIVGCVDDVADHVREYAPDYFPANADAESVEFDDYRYDSDGKLVLEFAYEELPEDADEEEEDSEDEDIADHKNDEARDER